MKRWMLVCSLLAANVFAADYTLTLRPEDVQLGRPVTLTLRGKTKSENVRVARVAGSVGRPLLVATLLDGTCQPDARDTRGCDELRVDFRTGRLEFRSFARQKGFRAALVDLGDLWDVPPLHIASRATRARPAVSIVIASTETGPLVLTTKLGNRTFTRTVDSRPRTYPASVAALAGVLHNAVAVSDAVVRTTGKDTGEQPPSTGNDDTGFCSVCDFCRDQPGGQTLGGCLGISDDGGGGGGGEPTPPLPPSPTPPTPPPPTPPSSCTLKVSRVQRILVDVLVHDLGVTDLCGASLSGFTAPTASFALNGEAKAFKTRLGAVPSTDLRSRGCAGCFFDVAKRFEASGVGVSSAKAALEPKCIRTYADLTDPSNAIEHAGVLEIARHYRDDLGSCKRSCDAAGAAHRAYCDCLPDYLKWEPGPPRPGTSACPK
jgi:hypothetical protein